MAQTAWKPLALTRRGFTQARRLADDAPAVAGAAMQSIRKQNRRVVGGWGLAAFDTATLLLFREPITAT
jgi:hypothetical protein